MSGATDYTQNNVINALLRGKTFEQASTIYLALHTADPTETGTANEVSTTDWPSYQRIDTAQGGAIDSGWTASSDGESKNAIQLLFPVFDGESSVVVTHWSLRSAATGGNALTKGQLDSSRELKNGDVFVVGVQKFSVEFLES